jgi:microcystin-dependent protein
VTLVLSVAVVMTGGAGTHESWAVSISGPPSPSQLPGDGSVTSDKIGNGSVTTEKLADGAVTTEKIATNAVAISTIATFAVTAPKIAPDAVTTSKIADGAVTAGKVADGFGFVPTGVVLDWALPAAPGGWALCDGAPLPTETPGGLRQALLDAGSPFGVGVDGNPLLPDLRGRVTAGMDNMGGASAGRLTTGGSGVDGSVLGAVGGAETVTLTSAQIPAHRHTVGTVPTSAARDSAGSLGATQGSEYTGYSGGGGAHNNMPPVVIMNAIIKL